MRAERDRRALILTAEGTKQSAILTAEGARQAEILRAEGDKQAAVLRAQGEAEAIQTVFSAIHLGNPDDKLLAYQYLQTLPKIADSASSKLWIIPSEFTEALKGMSRAFAGVGRRRRPSEERAQAPRCDPPPKPPSRRRRDATAGSRAPRARGSSPTAVCSRRTAPRTASSENSFAAVAAAHAAGAVYVESDCHLTADGVVVLFHDDDLSRVTGDPRRVARGDRCASSRRSWPTRGGLITLAQALEAFPDGALQPRREGEGCRRRRSGRIVAPHAAARAR